MACRPIQVFLLLLIAGAIFGFRVTNVSTGHDFFVISSHGSMAPTNSLESDKSSTWDKKSKHSWRRLDKSSTGCNLPGLNVRKVSEVIEGTYALGQAEKQSANYLGKGYGLSCKVASFRFQQGSCKFDMEAQIEIMDWSAINANQPKVLRLSLEGQVTSSATKPSDFDQKPTRPSDFAWFVSPGSGGKIELAGPQTIDFPRGFRAFMVSMEKVRLQVLRVGGFFSTTDGSHEATIHFHVVLIIEEGGSWKGYGCDQWLTFHCGGPQIATAKSAGATHHVASATDVAAAPQPMERMFEMLNAIKGLVTCCCPGRSAQDTTAPEAARILGTFKDTGGLFTLQINDFVALGTSLEFDLCLTLQIHQTYTVKTPTIDATLHGNGIQHQGGTFTFDINQPVSAPYGMKGTFTLKKLQGSLAVGHNLERVEVTLEFDVSMSSWKSPYTADLSRVS